MGILLDRDGVLNINRENYTKSIEEVALISGTIEALSLLWQRNYKICVVTNQSGIAKGLYTRKKVQEIHQYMQKQFGNGGKIHWYFCPHCNEDQCECRKPKPGMLLQAMQEHQLNPQKTWLVGDAPRDIEAGKKAGCRTALVLSGLTCNLEQATNVSDIVYKNLREFVIKEIVEKDGK